MTKIVSFSRFVKKYLVLGPVKNNQIFKPAKVGLVIGLVRWTGPLELSIGVVIKDHWTNKRIDFKIVSMQIGIFSRANVLMRHYTLPFLDFFILVYS